MSKLIRIALCTAFVMTLLGNGLACNTTEGAGKDIEKGGENLKDAANRNK